MCRRGNEAEGPRLGLRLVGSHWERKRRTEQAVVPVSCDIWREKMMSKLADSRARDHGSSVDV